MIGNGSVSGFISVLSESFQMDAYTEISIQVKGAKEETAFTKEYDNLVDETKKQVEAIQSEREDIRREELMQQMIRSRQNYWQKFAGGDGNCSTSAPTAYRAAKDKPEQGKWYVNDREDLTEYSGYGENADRMRAIGESISCFILFSCGVDQPDFYDAYGGRAEDSGIGTLKALGYSRRSIAGKYLGYAFWATVGRLCVRCAGWRKKSFLILL